MIIAEHLGPSIGTWKQTVLAEPSAFNTLACSQAVPTVKLYCKYLLQYLDSRGQKICIGTVVLRHLQRWVCGIAPRSDLKAVLQSSPTRKIDQPDADPLHGGSHNPLRPPPPHGPPLSPSKAGSRMALLWQLTHQPSPNQCYVGGSADRRIPAQVQRSIQRL